MLEEKQQSLSEYIDVVYQAFNKHCEQVHEETVKKLRETAEDDGEARKQILAEQKAELDKSLAELKEVSESDLKNILQEASRFASLVCQSFDNYIPKPN